MNPFLRFMKKLSLLFGRGRFRSELEEEMAFHRGRRAIDHQGGKTFELGDNVGQAVKPGELWGQSRLSNFTIVETEKHS